MKFAKLFELPNGAQVLFMPGEHASGTACITVQSLIEVKPGAFHQSEMNIPIDPDVTDAAFAQGLEKITQADAEEAYRRLEKAVKGLFR